MCTLWVSGLPDGIDDETFRGLFDGYAEILSLQCNPDENSGSLTYASKENAEYVKENTDGFEFCGTALRVSLAPETNGSGAGAYGKNNAGKGYASKGRNGEDLGKSYSYGGGGGGGKSDGEDWGTNGKAGKGGSQSYSYGGGGGGKNVILNLSGKSWGKGGKLGGKSWTPQPTIEADPSDNLYIKGLPVEFTSAMCEEVFGAYGKIMQCKLMNYSTDSCALMRMSSEEEATKMVQELHGQIPPGLTSPISVRFADSPKAKAKKIQAAMAESMGTIDEEYGPAKGFKGKDKSSPYGKGGADTVPCGNLDPNLPPEISVAVDVALINLGGKGKGKRRFPHEGDESNLYVKDLPSTADELYIYKVFSPFGALESITVKKGPDGSWAIAFVKFMTGEGAANAVLGLNNCLLPDGTMPKVSVKTKNASK